MKKSLSMVLLLTGGLLYAGGAAEEKKELQVLSGLWSPAEEQLFIRENILPDFEQQSGAKVTLETLKSAELLKKAEFGAQSGQQSAGVLIVHNGDMPTYINKGLVSPLDDLIADMSDRSFIDTFATSTKMGGQTYFLPIAADVYLTIANKELLTYLPAGTDFEALSWDDYAAWSVAASQAKGNGQVIAPAKPQNNLIYQLGALELSYGADFPDIDSPGAKQAWAVLQRIADGGGYTSAMKSTSSIIDPMKRGEAGLSVFHMNPVGEVYSYNPTMFAVGPAPMGPKGRGSIAGAYGIAVASSAPDQELAKRLIRYLTQPDILYRMSVGTGGFIPPVKEVMSRLGDDPEDEVIRQGIALLGTGVVAGVPAAQFQDWGAVKTVYDEMFADVIAGTALTEDRLAAYQQRIDALRK